MRNSCKLSLGAMMALGLSSVAIGQTPTPPRPPTPVAGRAVSPPTAGSDSLARRAAPRARRAMRAQVAARAQRMQRAQGAAQRTQQVQRQARPQRSARAQRMQPQRMQQRQGVQRMQQQRMQQPRMAQPPRGMPGQRFQQSPQRAAAGAARSNLFRGLTLSEAQTSQMRAVRERSRTRTMELRQQLRPDRAPGTRPDSTQRAAMRERSRTVREQAAAIRQQEAAELRAVLTPEQQKTFDANRQRAVERSAARRERMDRRGRSPGQPRPL